MAGERDDRYVSCPYYLGLNSEEQRKRCQIRCEGIGIGNTVSLVFGSESDRRKHKRTFCYDVKECRKCLIHRMLNIKYGVSDEQ